MWKPKLTKYTIVDGPAAALVGNQLSVSLEVSGFSDGDAPQLWLVHHLNDTPAARFQEAHPNIAKAGPVWTISAVFDLHNADHQKRYSAVVGILDGTGQDGEGVASQPFFVD